ncbi:hypothetical protein [Paraglaciecola sp. 2405UD69-4]|uniref:hypothetical protein n=1 Tax=Paraglaciecola sp. 2405UD69-4 TaxID=3391836 RepID=UPI0039C9C2B7
MSNIERLIIKRSDAKSTEVTTFVNQRNQPITVTVDYAFGGFSNGTLQARGDFWELHCRTQEPYDSFCWSPEGPCIPERENHCIGGKTYALG